MTLAREILICVVLVALAAFLVQGSLCLQSINAVAVTGSRTLAGVDLLRVTLQAQLLGKQGILSRLDGALQNSNALLIQAGLTADEVRRTTLEERRKVAQFSDASIAAVRGLDQTIRTGDGAMQELRATASGVRGVIAGLERDSDAAKQAIDATTGLVSTLNAKTGAALDRTTETISNVNALVVSAAPIEEHVLSTSRHLDDGADALAQTLAYVRDDFAPKKKTFWLKLADLATSGMVSAVFRLWPVQRVHEVGR